MYFDNYCGYFGKKIGYKAGIITNNASSLVNYVQSFTGYCVTVKIDDLRYFMNLQHIQKRF